MMFYIVKNNPSLKSLFMITLSGYSSHKSQDTSCRTLYHNCYIQQNLENYLGPYFYIKKKKIFKLLLKNVILVTLHHTASVSNAFNSINTPFKTNVLEKILQ